MIFNFQVFILSKFGSIINRFKTLLDDNMTLSDEIIDKMVEAAREKANEIGLDISFAVYDEYGYQKYFRRFGNALLFSTTLVPAKAYTAAMMEMPTHVLAKLSAQGAPLQDVHVLDSKMTLVSGGYPLYIDGKIAGGIGVGGGKGSEDDEIAKYVLEVFSKLTNE